MPLLQHSVVPTGGGDTWQGFKRSRTLKCLASGFFFFFDSDIEGVTTSCVVPHPAYFFLKGKSLRYHRLALPGYIAKDDLSLPL